MDDPHVGINIAKRTLYKICDVGTVLFLSGGSTPKPLYKSLAEEVELRIGAAAMIDDRYSFHQEYSNEPMIKESGFEDFLANQNIPFYKILEFGVGKGETTKKYNETVSFLLNHFTKSVGIMGIGEDGHTAGILPGIMQNSEFVQEFHFPDSQIKDRITLTFKALSMFDLLVVLVFGDEKKNALDLMFSEGSEEEVPARFYNRKELDSKVLLITDQKL